MATKFRFNLNNQLVDFDDFYVRKEQFLQSRSGNLWAWGTNQYYGQLGDNTTIHRSSPVQTVAGGSDWLSISMGNSFTCGIKVDGTLWTWGRNEFGALGDNTIIHRPSPVQTTALGTNWTNISCGDRHMGAIKTDGTLWLWGWNNAGQLGDNTLLNKSSPVQTIAVGTKWSKVSCGGTFTAAIANNNTLWIWGRNSFGELGDGRAFRGYSSPIQTITYGNNWSKISVSYFNAVAIKTDGTLWTWGDNLLGALGNNTVLNSNSPIQTIALGNNWISISCGLRFAAAIKSDGTLWMWGENSSGQLGDNTFTRRSSPVQTIAGGTNWSQIACGTSHTAAIKTDGTLWVWGNNFYGYLGDNTNISRSSPVQTISPTTDWSFVSAGQHTAAIKKDGTLWMWGINSNGQLGINSIFNISSPVQTVTFGTNWSQVSCGQYHTGAIKTDGTLWMWGRNDNGQLGDNTFTRRSSPVQTISAGFDWQNVFCSSFTLGLKKDGTLWSWGINDKGQLADNTTVVRRSPVQIIGFNNDWTSEISNSLYSGAIKKDGTLWLWGSAFESGTFILGNGAYTTVSSPIQTVTYGNDWNIVATGYGHISAIKNDGSLWTWGNNDFGQLGNYLGLNNPSPTYTLAGGNNWIKTACGNRHTAAIKTDGTLWVWGRNNFGQLGDNTTISKSSPIQTISYGNNWSFVACGENQTVAVKTDGTLWVWGRNSYGELGDNTTISKSSPVQTIALGKNWKLVAGGVGATAAIAYADTGSVSSLRANPVPSLPTPYTIPGLVLYLDASVASSYPGTGTSWYNLAYIGNTATLTNGPTFSSSNGGTFLFDGSNDYAAPAVSPLNAYPFTISIWVTHSGSWNPGSEVADVLVNTSIAGQRVTAGIVNVASWGPPAIVLAYGGTSHFTCPNPSTTGATDWHNITFVIYGSADTRHQIFIDGVSQTVTNRAGSHGGTAGWRIGASIDGEYWFGNIGVVQVYNTALSATDVTNLFNYHRSRFGV